MSVTRRSLLLATLAVAATPARADGEEPLLTISGELTYLQRIALPDDAVAIVELKPADAADGASVTAEEIIPLRGRQVPVAFELKVERARLDSEKSYILRGGIREGSRLRWLSEPVAVDVASDAVSLGTVQVRPYQAPDPAGTDEVAAIAGIEWKIDSIGDIRITGDERPTLTFDADGSFHGRACNGFRGSYEIDGERLSLGRAAATMMACPEPQMAWEHALFDAFGRVAHFSVMRDSSLRLMDDGGDLLIEARP